MNFATYFYLEEGLKERIAAIGLAGLAALSSKGGDMSVSFNYPPKTQSITHTSTQTNTNSFLEKAAKYIEKHEGKRNKLYKDHKGYWTIGIGHLVTKKELSRFKGRTLSEREILDLFNKDLTRKLALARRLFGKTYDTYTDDVKIAILDGLFRGDLSGSPKTINLIRQGKFREASIEYLNNREYRQSKKDGTGVHKRMEQNAKILALNS